jgi:predicted DsbA family dithiol-disulfide isomerase
MNTVASRTQGSRDAAGSKTSLAVDVVSDIVCPWCFIGKRKLERALLEMKHSEPSLLIEVRWHPFQLNPDLPADGVARASYVARKFGNPARATEVYARVTNAGESVGIPFRLDRIERQPNTFDAHRLVAWAQRQGDATALVERLFNAFFLEGVDIGDRAELARLAAEAGWSEHDVVAILDSHAMREEVEKESREALDVGIQGVPFFIFNGRIAVSGAQDSSVLREAMTTSLV